jgi:hypothetical protein
MKSFETLNEQGRQYLARGRYTEAISTLDEVLQSDPANATALQRKGRISLFGQFKRCHDSFIVQAKTPMSRSTASTSPAAPECAEQGGKGARDETNGAPSAGRPDGDGRRQGRAARRLRPAPGRQRSTSTGARSFR